MKVAVLSDIHANLEALTAVSADLKQQNADRVVCLGDVVGYGPDPDRVVTFIRTSGYDCIMGNHEFALNDARGRRWFNFLAAENNVATEKLLSFENRNYCRDLPLYLNIGQAHFVHGYPRDNVFRYLHRQSDDILKKLFESPASDYYFVGHTHKLQVVFMAGAEIRRKRLLQEVITLQNSVKYIFNCGSVGQPRDRDNRAKYLIWDSSGAEVEVRFVSYDHALTAEKIKKRGFPLMYAKRLE